MKNSMEFICKSRITTNGKLCDHWIIQLGKDKLIAKWHDTRVKNNSKFSANGQSTNTLCYRRVLITLQFMVRFNRQFKALNRKHWTFKYRLWWYILRKNIEVWTWKCVFKIKYVQVRHNTSKKALFYFLPD